MLIQYEPIGIIHTPFKKLSDVPVQPAGALGVKGTVELIPYFEAGLKDLDGFSHLILLYHFHRSRNFRLRVTPFLDSVKRGLFATRTPNRPNPIGLSVVRLIEIQRTSLRIENVDILDCTPLLDIKPYIPEIDAHTTVRTGWFEDAVKDVKTQTTENRHMRNGKDAA